MIFNRQTANTQVLRHHPLKAIMPMAMMYRPPIHLKLLLQNERFCFVPPVKKTKSNGWERSVHLLHEEQTLGWFLGKQNSHPLRVL